MKVYEFTKKEEKEDKSSPPDKKFFSAFTFIIAFILLIFGVYFIYINRYHPAIQNLLIGKLGAGVVQKPSSIPFDIEAESQIKVYKEYIVFCSKDGLKAMNKEGQEEWSIALTLSNPMIETTDKYILLTDKGGREVHVVTNYSIICTKKTEEPIKMAKINDKGYFAVVTEEKGYEGKVTVYNPQGLELYKWFSVENPIIDVDISPDGKRMAVCTLDVKKGKVSGGIVFFNLNEVKPYAGVVIEDTLLAGIRFYKDNDLIAVGDNQVVGFSSEGIQQWSIPFEERILQAYNMDSKDMVVIALGRGKDGGLIGNDSSIEIINRNGQKQGSYKVDGEVKFLSVQDDFIAFNNKRDVCIITPRGAEVASATSSKDIRDIQLFQNKREVLLVSRNSLDVLELRRKQ
ncbi:MAG: hypothetical protein GX066_03220 [Clostridiaceae bacterium]|nr:hypothetical protein [Clostridiaceae bacterium]